jgi:hypothetical protein
LQVTDTWQPLPQPVIAQRRRSIKFALVTWCCAKIQAEAKRQTYSIERSFPERSYLTGSPSHLHPCLYHDAALSLLDPHHRRPSQHIARTVVFHVSTPEAISYSQSASLSIWRSSVLPSLRPGRGELIRAYGLQIADTWQPPPHPVLSPKSGWKNGPLNSLLSLGRWERRHHARRIPSSDP